jgi:hypothetical protein
MKLRRDGDESGAIADGRRQGRRASEIAIDCPSACMVESLHTLRTKNGLRIASYLCSKGLRRILTTEPPSYVEAEPERVPSCKSLLFALCSVRVSLLFA